MEINNLPPSQTGIDPTTQSGGAAARETTGAPAQNQNPAVRPGAGDQVSLTPEARQLRDLESQVAKLPEVDSNRVNDIKAQLANGSFEVNPERIAEKMMSLERAIGDLN